MLQGSVTGPSWAFCCNCTEIPAGSRVLIDARGTRVAGPVAPTYWLVYLVLCDVTESQVGTIKDHEQGTA